MSCIRVSWVIAAREPSKLAEFYAFAMDASMNHGPWDSKTFICHRDGIELQFYKPSSKLPWPSTGRSTAICLQKQSSSNPLLVLEEWSASLSFKGAKREEDIRLAPFGAELWLKDPEGNNFLILVPKS